MNTRFLRAWKDGVHELNNMSYEVKECRKEAQSLIFDKIKDVFERNETVVESAKFTDDLSVITVKLKCDTENAIYFNRKFMFEIGMPFSVQRVLNEDLNQELIVELYPLED